MRIEDLQFLFFLIVHIKLNAQKLHMHQFSISSQLCSPQPKYTDMTLPKLIFDEAVKADVEAGREVLHADFPALWSPDPVVIPVTRLDI